MLQDFEFMFNITNTILAQVDGCALRFVHHKELLFTILNEYILYPHVPLEKEITLWQCMNPQLNLHIPGRPIHAGPESSVLTRQKTWSACAARFLSNTPWLAWVLNACGRC